MASTRLPNGVLWKYVSWLPGVWSDMLTQLKIKNYQIQKDLTVPLGRVTSIVGPTDAGKSAVLRALWWALANVGPTNPGHHGTNDTNVTVTIDGGTTITRYRTNRENGYIITSPGGPDNTYKAIRYDVPLEVQRLLAVHPNSYQRQHDGAFWLANSASEVGRALNAVVDLDVIDTGLTFAKKLEAEANAAANALTTTIKITDAELAALAWVDRAAPEWEVYKALCTRSAQLRSNRAALAGLLRSTTEAVDRARNLAARHAAARAVETLVNIVHELKQTRVKIQNLLRATTNRLHGLRADAEAVITLQDRARPLIARRVAIDTAIRNVHITGTLATACHATYTEAVEAAARCPTCGKPL